MNKKLCPICGNGSLIKKTDTRVFTDSTGEKVEIDVPNYYCENCESYGDFFKENSLIISKALKELDAKAIKKVLAEIVSSNDKIKMSRIERALGLSQRTLTKWKIGATKPNSSSVALFKLINLFPFLIDVAENDYTKEAANFAIRNCDQVASMITENVQVITIADGSSKRYCEEIPIDIDYNCPPLTN
jgi:YgiT-type zinc finger domain-containing protein